MSRRGIYAAALVVAAAAVEVVHRPAVTTYCHAGRRCRGGRGHVGKNKQRGVADHQPNAPAGRVYMRHFRSLP